MPSSLETISACGAQIFRSVFFQTPSRPTSMRSRLRRIDTTGARHLVPTLSKLVLNFSLHEFSRQTSFRSGPITSMRSQFSLERYPLNSQSHRTRVLFFNLLRSLLGL